MITARANGAAFWLSCSCVTQRTDHVKLQSVLGNPRWHGIYVAVYSAARTWYCKHEQNGLIVALDGVADSLLKDSRNFQQRRNRKVPTVRPLRKINDRHYIYGERLIGAFA